VSAASFRSGPEEGSPAQANGPHISAQCRLPVAPATRALSAPAEASIGSMEPATSTMGMPFAHRPYRSDAHFP
jgi:hypothetical protein